MDYQQVIEENPTITQSQAIEEIKLHSCNISEFFEECGNKKDYKALTVLHWLGY